MAVQIEMPQLSSEGEHATLASWLVEPGDAVERGEVIAELETDKATVELEAPASGRIAELVVPAGTEDIGPGTVLGAIEADAADDGEANDRDANEGGANDRDASQDGAVESERGSEPEKDAPGSEPDPSPLAGSGASPDPVRESAEGEPSGRSSREPQGGASEERSRTSRRRPTPLAQRVAQEHGVDLSALEGSGPGGRVVEADVLRAAEEGAPGAVGSHTESGASERIAGVAARSAPARPALSPLRLRMRCAMDSLLEVESGLEAERIDPGAGRARISTLPLVLKALALALRAVPEASPGRSGEALRVPDPVDVAISLLSRSGWVMPVVREADGKGLATLADEIESLRTLSRTDALGAEQLEGGRIVLWDLDGSGIESVDPILASSQAAALAVGDVEERAVVREGGVAIGRVAVFSLAVDPELVDVAVAARLMAALRARIEDPLGMIF